MRTETVSYYRFDELSDEARKRAVQAHKDAGQAFERWNHEAAVEQAVEAFLRALGSDAEDVDLIGHLDLSFCQGAGFSVTGAVTLGGTEYRIVEDRWSGLRNHYVHSGTVTVEYVGDDDHSQYDEVPAEVRESFRSAMDAGYRAAEEYYWATTEDDEVARRILDGEILTDFEYLENGTPA